MKGFKRGFTLVETLIVLMISALLLSLSLLMTHKLSLNQFQDFFFWKRFQNQLELSENVARHHNLSILIEFPSRGPVAINFLSSNKFKKRKITPPRNLKVMKPNWIKFNKNGYDDDPKTISWLLNNRTVINQKFQLGWGMYTFDYK